MRASEAQRAASAAIAVASGLGLSVDDAIVLSDSNRLVVRLTPVDYAVALQHLHAGLRQVDGPSPHVIDRVTATQRDAASRDVTPELTEADRALLTYTLWDLGRAIGHRRGSEQVLHGEPHPWNVLHTTSGLRFADLDHDPC